MIKMNQEKINEILELWESSNYSGNKDEFANVDFENVNFKNANLEDANFNNANLENAYFYNANLEDAYFNNANLENAYFNNANFYNVNFYNANLKNANLENAYFYNVNFYNANLEDANLKNAKFSDKLIIKNNKRSYYAESDYYCWIFEGIIKIGCEVHSYKNWKSFTDKEILKMDGKKALKFWKKEKEIILKIHDDL